MNHSDKESIETSSQTEGRGLTARNKTILSFVLGASLILIILIVTIIRPCPSDAQFFMYKIILAIALAGVAAVIPGFLRIHYQNTISAGGAIAVFVLVFLYEPAIGNVGCDFDLTVLFYGDEEKSRILREGRVVFNYSGITTTKFIDNEGQVILRKLNTDLRGEKLRINPEIEAFETSQLSVSFPESESQIDIIVNPKKDTTRIRGSILNAHNLPLSNATIDIEGYKTQTDNLGDYELNIPFSKGKVAVLKVSLNDSIILYRGNIVISPSLGPIKIE